MKNLRKNKSGISLIVLVITIIVMIILAAAIILSLSNSGIISKANKAKTDSDTANLKEYVNTLRAEWELMTAEEQTAAGSFVDYANKKLEANGYNVMLSDDGVLMNEAATAAVKAGIKVGDTVTGYTLDVATYTTDGSENTCDAKKQEETDPQPQEVTANTQLRWKYLGVNANGELEIMADLGTTEVAANTKVTLGGKGGYLKGPDMLNTICEKLYSKDGVGTARNMNIDDVNNILGYIGEKGSYYYIDDEYTPTKEAKTIATLESELGMTLDGRTTPDGKDLGMYYLDYYNISRTDDVKKMKKPGNVDLVYNAKNEYWLASPCVSAMFFGNMASFSVRSVNSAAVGENGMFSSYDYFAGHTYALRPVVTLNSNVKLTPNADKTEWEIKK